MNKITKVRIIITLLVSFLVLSGCSVNLNNGEENSEAVDLMSQIGSSSWPEAPDSIDTGFKKSVLDFSWELFQLSSANKDNIMISPASVYLALGMAYNGADSETRQAMTDVLKITGISPEDFNKSCRDYISILNTMGEKTELSIANAIWYREGYNPAEDFLRKNADYFAASVKALDFNTPDAVKTINGWVKKETHDTIDKIIDKINSDVVMYLMNAVYFKSDWQQQFSASDTKDGIFWNDKGKVTALYMNRTGNMDYIDTDGIEGVLLPYDDGRFSFFALLPEEGENIRTFIKKMDGEKIFEYMDSVRNGRISLSLPKFETRYEDSLKDELTHMGMGVAFEPYKADFSLMNANRQKDLFISEVKHKTYCRVDEQGTEASAVTSIEISITSMPAEPQIKIVFNRPFVYGIVDTVTLSPLFLGVMDNPAD